MVKQGFVMDEHYTATLAQLGKKFPGRAQMARGQPLSSVLAGEPAELPAKFQEHVTAGHLLDKRDEKGRWIRP